MNLRTEKKKVKWHVIKQIFQILETFIFRFPYFSLKWSSKPRALLITAHKNAGIFIFHLGPVSVR